MQTPEKADDPLAPILAELQSIAARLTALEARSIPADFILEPGDFLPWKHGRLMWSGQVFGADVQRADLPSHPEVEAPTSRGLPPPEYRLRGHAELVEWLDEVFNDLTGCLAHIRDRLLRDNPLSRETPPGAPGGVDEKIAAALRAYDAKLADRIKAVTNDPRKLG